MQTNVNPFKQLVCLIRGSGEQLPPVITETADQTVGRSVQTQGARIRIIGADTWHDVNLPPTVQRLFRTASLVERGQSAFREYERARRVIALNAAGKLLHANAGGLKPLRIHEFPAAVGHRKPNIEFIIPGRDHVFHLKVRLDRSAKAQHTISLIGEEHRAVRKRGLIPIAIMRTTAAERFEIPNLDLAPRQIRAAEGQEVICPRDIQRARRRGEQQKKK